MDATAELTFVELVDALCEQEACARSVTEAPNEKFVSPTGEPVSVVHLRAADEGARGFARGVRIRGRVRGDALAQPSRGQHNSVITELKS